MALYHAIELGQAGKPECPDQYNEESTLICPGCRLLVVQIKTHNVFVQLGVMPQGVGVGAGAVVWQAEEPFEPLVASLRRRFDAVRVRNWSPGEKAVLFLSVA
jgi:hypothetical protein